MAADETATVTSGVRTASAVKWVQRQVDYLDRLVNEVGYRPGDWERAQLEEARARVVAHAELSCPACQCRYGDTCGRYAYDHAASRYLSCDVQPGADGAWSYSCN